LSRSVSGGRVSEDELQADKEGAEMDIQQEQEVTRPRSLGEQLVAARQEAITAKTEMLRWKTVAEVAADRVEELENDNAALQAYVLQLEERLGEAQGRAEQLARTMVAVGVGL
jgi:hypothetical protein